MFQPRTGVEPTGWREQIEELAITHGCVVLEGDFDPHFGRGYFVYAYPHTETGASGPIGREWKASGMYLSIHPVPVLIPARPLSHKLIHYEIPADSDFIK